MKKVDPDALENALNKGALWAVTYGDLMSYLMLFFLILYSFTISKAAERKPGSLEHALGEIQEAFGGEKDEGRIQRAKKREAEQAAAQKLQETVDGSTVEGGQKLSQFVDVKVTQGAVKLVLKEPILFDLGKADLKPQATEVLDLILVEIKKLPNTVMIEGHTDNIPIRGGRYSSNWELSMARAYSVVRYFELKGLAPARLSGSGYGEYRPAADNATPEGRARNRRIELNLIRTE